LRVVSLYLSAGYIGRLKSLPVSFVAGLPILCIPLFVLVDKKRINHHFYTKGDSP